MAASKTIVLVTGANSGIGYEVARQLLASKDTHVLLGSRSVDKGEKAVSTLQSLNLPGTVELLHLDVSFPDSITAAAKKVTASHGYITHLVNNAGVAMPSREDTPLHELMDLCFRTNATGTLLTTEAFGPLLKGATPRIVNVSSGAGSITRRLDPTSVMYKTSAVHYRASKAAMNMISADLSVLYGEKGVKVFAFCPGFTESGLSGMNTVGNGAKPVSEGAKPILDILEGKRDAEHGLFLHVDGTYPW
ncbi:hypothetical protein M409DRAFT_29299 [Zasmidium cellare ATCC 36951]|uniref:Uncharacterized protein n=1 Tax=Zasmidium cellare ATCC 36951 TaxID=1080233 RepID=A0A6A6BZJ7_ZASCE|nr:uncharacterized protein M409DRAFT_29299 [Zasmidium cellare ATCC 36951]KAF2160214.1 hypothetical protein M409DRAFT_29299 [Zasmidium cellare ATCC 36951]